MCNIHIIDGIDIPTHKVSCVSILKSGIMSFGLNEIPNPPPIINTPYNKATRCLFWLIHVVILLKHQEKLYSLYLMKKFDQRFHHLEK